MELTLKNRKVLFSRVAIMATMQQHREKAYVLELGTDFDAVQAGLFRAANDASKAGDGSSDNIPLDVFAKTVPKKMRPILDTFEEPSQRTLQPIFESVAAELESISCDRCKPLTDCDGTSSKFKLRGGEECVKPFLMNYRLVLDEVMAWYTRYSVDFANLRLPEVLLSIRQYQRPTTLHICRNIGGTTKYEDKGEHLVSKIELHLNVPEFDSESYFAVPYVIFHELICHAFNGVRSSYLPRQETPETDRFAEGWMDYVAYRVFNEVMEGNGLTNHVIEDYASEYAMQGASLHRVRQEYDRTPQVENSMRANFMIGAHAAQFFLRTLRSMFPEEAEELFLRISFDLNLTRDRSKCRRKLVDLVYDSHRNPSVEGDVGAERIRRLLRKYRSTNDVGVFLALEE
jgi:hypothetical protein